MLKAALEKESEKLLACVHCGLCLPVCPTYRQLGNENDSPRGRLYLMRARAEGRLELTPAYEKHIDLCLGCRACETACPSGVRFGNLLETARAEIVAAPPSPEHKRTFSARMQQRLTGFVLNNIFTRPKLLAWNWMLMRLAQRSGLVGLALKLRLFRFAPQLEFSLALLGQADSQLKQARELIKAQPNSQPGTTAVLVSTNGGKPVAQFTGCVMEGLFTETNRATTRVLNANGCTVENPPTQFCCGALHAHSGYHQTALELAKANIDQFVPVDGRSDDRPIIINAAGCGAMLKEYGELLAGDPHYAERARAFSARVKDISEFLAVTGVKPGNAVAQRVTYDAPCHLYHGQAVRQQPIDLIKQIPGVEYIPLAGAEQCCGSAGIYNITHPEMAGKLLQEKLENIKKTGATILVTGNPGCAMHIGAGLRLAGEKIILLHPVELLDLMYR